MIDVIRFHARGLRMGARNLDEFESMLGGMAPLPCLSAQSWTKGGGGYDHPLLIAKLEHGSHLLADIIFRPSVTGVYDLWKITANLPSLIRGHNGTLLKSSEEYVLSLTRLACLVDRLLCESDKKKIFREAPGRQCWSVVSAEVSAQFEDPDRQVIKDSHLSQLKYFPSKPEMSPGESTRFDSESFCLQVYAKDREAEQHHLGAARVTRVELRFKRMRNLLKCLGLQSEPELATLPFDRLFPVLREVLSDRLLGGLATPKGKDLKLRCKSRQIAEKWWSPVLMHDALHAELELRGAPRKRELRKAVFDHFSRMCPSDLPSLFSCEWEDFSHAPVERPVLESSYMEAIDALQLPYEPDPEIARTFSTLITNT